jgi:hypothetical protein
VTAIRARAGLVALAALAGACGMFAEDTGPVACPEVLLVADAATVNSYREGSGRDLTDVRFSAQLIDTAWVCAYDDEGMIDVEITIALMAARGPAADSPTARFEYFVALADTRQRILAKQVFPLEIAFEGNIDSVELQRVVGTAFHVGDDTTGSRHRIYIGFQVSADQLEDNRQSLGGG